MNKKFGFLFLAIIVICAAGAFCLSFSNIVNVNYVASLIGSGQKPAPVYHIFFHSLIIYPELAFSKNDRSTEIYKKNMITNTEFEKILQELYKNQFVLVDVGSMY
jgi:hypothetical protein